MTNFSERYGYVPQRPAEPIIEDAPRWVRSKYVRLLWHFTYVDDDHRYSNSEGCPLGVKHLNGIILDLLRREAPPNAWDSFYCHDFLDDLVSGVQWYHFYDIVELIGQELKQWQENFFKGLQRPGEEKLISDRINDFGLNRYSNEVNNLLSEENVGWRLDRNGFVVRESPKEMSDRIEKIEETLTDEFEPAREHYRKAVRFANARPSDPANSIKEIVSAVESVGRVLYPKANTLGDVVKEMRREQVWPQQLVSVIEKFYGFACSEPGVRHGGPKTSNVILDDAEFCQHVGAALTRYMIAHFKRRS